MKLGLFKFKFPIRKLENKVRFRSTTQIKDYNLDWAEKLIIEADRIMSGEFTWFSHHRFYLGEIPNWFCNPFSQQISKNSKKHWTKIGDFSSGIGDIKIVWELSRFDWLLVLARANKVTNEQKYLDRLNVLLADWCKNNPLNQGPNWMCGQEASFRLMKIITTASLLEAEQDDKENLFQLVAHHVDRINANITYGVVQDNNHGTSEAAGLYIGAAWLFNQGYQIHKYNKLRLKGRRILEDRILHLIQTDGTFSQRSTNYHRVVIDTMSFVLAMMKSVSETPFDQNILQRLVKLGEWQFKMTLGTNGQVPNFGSNDGAMIETLHSLDYRDVRGSTQLFFISLLGKRVYSERAFDEASFWRHGNGINNLPSIEIEIRNSEILDQQILLMRNGGAVLFLKLPEATFRPGNDAFHLDLWINGKNVLRDSGTYSYNAGEITEQFKSVQSHNTVQFGDHEQMPKISRFLYGKWLKLESISSSKSSKNTFTWEGTYIDYKKNLHTRSIELKNNSLSLEDTVHTTERAKAHFHIAPDMQGLNFCMTTSGEIKESISEISFFYMQKEKQNLRIINFQEKCTTQFSWKIKPYY